MKLAIQAGSISQRAQIFIPDSSSTVGAGLTGLLFNSAELTAYYLRDGAAAPVAITLVTAVVGTYASGGFIQVSSANMPGHYEIGIPNAALIPGSDKVIIMLKGATNMVPVSLEIQLSDIASTGDRVELHAPSEPLTERAGAVSCYISRGGFPPYGAIFTIGSTFEFNTAKLIGALIENPNASVPTQDRFFVIVGGYLHNSDGNVTLFPFGKALDPEFGITEGGSVKIATNWTASGAVDINEDGTAGWTFIVMPKANNAKFPTEGQTIKIWLKGAIPDGAPLGITTYAEAFKTIDFVTFDNLIGAAGITFPTGLPNAPSSVIADAFSIMSANKITKLKIRSSSDLSPVANLNHLHLLGVNRGAFKFDLVFASDAAGAVLERLRVYADTMAGTPSKVTLIDCDVDGVALRTHADWRFMRCNMQVALDLRGNAFINDCSFNYNLNTLVCSGIGTSTVFLTGCHGKITIDSLASAAIINLRGFRGEIVINASCTAGTINISGAMVKLTDNSAGTAVNKNSGVYTAGEGVIEELLKHEVNLKKIILSGGIHYLVVYKDDNATELRRMELNNFDGANIGSLVGTNTPSTRKKSSI